MRLIAHRGFAAVAPENTVAAITTAAGIADAVEFDVRRCGSGELVVVHDETLERLTGDPTPVATCPLETLRDRTVLDSAEPIPTLEAVLSALPPDVDVNLELKSRAIARDVLAELADAALPNRIVVTSFHESALGTVREVAPDQPIGLLVARDRLHPVSAAIELDCDVLGAHARRCLLTRLVPRAKRLDLEVHAWGVTGPRLARVLGWRGVDYVSADEPIQI